MDWEFGPGVGNGGVSESDSEFDSMGSEPTTTTTAAPRTGDTSDTMADDDSRADC